MDALVNFAVILSPVWLMGLALLGEKFFSKM